MAREKNLGTGAVVALVGAVIGVGGLIVAALARGARNPAEHRAPDLALDAPRPGTNRAPAAFRPDPTAVPSAGERESLRPATGHAPGFAADRNSTVDETTDAS